jgi:nucleotide-binding universal stress UspA family protein
MLPLRRILCPVDLSEMSLEALQVAVEFAQQYASQLLVMHVVPLIPQASSAGILSAGKADSEEYKHQVETASHEELKEIIGKRIPTEVRAEIMVRIGDPADHIVRMATESQVDLIVISTHGRSGWRRFVFGSVAEQVTRYAPCPVLIVRAHHTER